MRRIPLFVLALTVGCGGGSSSGSNDNSGGGAGDGSANGGADDGGGEDGQADGGAGDGGVGDGAADGGDADGGDADGGAVDCTGVGGPSGDDPLVTLTSAQVEGGVTTAALSADGASVITCEGGAAKSRSLADLTQVTDHAGGCPAALPKSVQVGDRSVTAAGPKGLTWDSGEVDTHAPVYALAPAGDADHAVTASWDAVYLWDLGNANHDYQRAREVLPSGPALGIIAAGEGKVVAWGPDGLSVLSVDPALKAPDIKVDTPSLMILCTDEGQACQGAIVLQNAGGAPLDVFEASIDGENMTVQVEHTGFDDPPDCVLAQASGIGGALITIDLAGGTPPAEVKAQLLLKTNDPDEPEFAVEVTAGAVALADGEDVPDFRLPDLDGNVHQLSKLRGKVVHIKYLNAICVSCREAIPVLETGIWTPRREAGGDDFEAFVVHVGRGTRFAATTNDDLGVISPMLLDLDGYHFQAAIQVANGSLAYPLALLVDKEGKVRHMSADEEPTNEVWNGWIDGLLAE